jgi:hypothetical protein
MAKKPTTNMPMMSKKEMNTMMKNMNGKKTGSSAPKKTGK